jgi:hypothetical protein
MVRPPRVPVDLQACALNAHLGTVCPRQSITLNRTSRASHYQEDVAKTVFGLYGEDFEAFGYDEDSWVRPSIESTLPRVPEAMFVDEVLERNIVIDHLYEQRDALKRRVRELEIRLRDREQQGSIENEATKATNVSPGPPSDGHVSDALASRMGEG